MFLNKKILVLISLILVFGVIIFLFKENDSSQGKKVIPTPTEGQPSTELSDKVEWTVPFTPQAPLGNWEDVKQGNGCEESCLLMAYSWVSKKEIEATEAVKEIEKMSDFSLKLLGHFHDISNEDTIKLMKEYYKFDKVYLETKVDAETIKTKLAEKNLLIVAVNGGKLNNPYYQIPEPANHKIIIIGYDETKREFITHDPGTSRGKGFRYNYEQLLDSITDYPTGYRESFETVVKSMIVVEKS